MSNQKINIYDLLKHLEKRKAMYLGNNYTFHSLCSFITGFIIASDENKLETAEYNNFIDFNIWILGHIPEHFGKGGGWHWQISNRNLNNDDNSFKEFFQFLEIFKNAKTKTEKVEFEKLEFVNSEYHSESKISINKKVIIDSIQKRTIEFSKAIWVTGFSKNKQTYEKWFINEKEYEKEIRTLKEN